MAATADQNQVPSALTGPAVSALVPPGKCQFGSDPIAVPLIERTQVSPTSALLRFALPNENEPLNLSTCACILANAKIKGEDVTRPYTPISTNNVNGQFHLLIKNYGPDSHMSYHMHNIKPGEKIKFTHSDKNVKIQAPFDEKFDHILMLTGGTGLTPMIQALHSILGGDNKSKPKVTMLYGSKVADDILGKELLEKWAEDHPDQFNLKIVLSDEPENSDWKGERGFITKELITDNFPKPDSDEKLMVFVCGPPPMYKALSGPREEADEVKGLLGEIGYKPEQVYKF